MTIIEAIKSGKRFKRSNNSYWIEVHPSGVSFVQDGDVCYMLDVPSVEATDWEVLVCDKHSVITDEWNNAVQGCPSCPLVAAIHCTNILHLMGCPGGFFDCLGNTDQRQRSQSQVAAITRAQLGECGHESITKEKCAVCNPRVKKCFCDMQLIIQRGCNCGGT